MRGVESKKGTGDLISGVPLLGAFGGSTGTVIRVAFRIRREGSRGTRDTCGHCAHTHEQRHRNTQTHDPETHEIHTNALKRHTCRHGDTETQRDIQTQTHLDYGLGSLWNALACVVRGWITPWILHRAGV